MGRPIPGSGVEMGDGSACIHYQEAEQQMVVSGQVYTLSQGPRDISRLYLNTCPESNTVEDTVKIQEISLGPNSGLISS